jgi:hypothetical protein
MCNYEDLLWKILWKKIFMLSSLQY